MTWSYNGYRQFQKCMRQWYYSNIVADVFSDDPYRRETTVLSRLKSLDAWRGDIVDLVISGNVISKIRNGQDLNENQILWVADQIFDKQLQSAREKTYRNPSHKFSEYDQMGAILDYDLGRDISNEDIKRVRSDVHIALRNFLKHDDIIEHLRDANQLLTQRGIMHRFSKFKVKGRPDLIAFFEDEPPHIFDWKVHTFATKTYDDQLMCYAYFLSHTEPHRDFPASLKEYDIVDYRLTEFQLLLDEVRDYTISQDDVDFTYDSISSGLLHMYQVGAHRPFDQVTPKDFPSTYDASACSTCSFTKQCKQHDNEIRNEHFSN